MISEDVDYSIRIIRAIFNNGEDKPIRWQDIHVKCVIGYNKSKNYCRSN